MTKNCQSNKQQREKSFAKKTTFAIELGVFFIIVVFVLFHNLMNS